MSEYNIGTFDDSFSPDKRDKPAPKPTDGDITIPERLRDDRLAFCMVRPLEKAAMNGPDTDTSWTKNPRKHNDPALLRHLQNGGNYGVMGGYGKLVIVDFDDPKTQAEKEPQLPESFTTKSGGKGLHHVYLFVKGDLKTMRLKGTADVQWQGAMVVGPNSRIKVHKRAEKIVDGKTKVDWVDTGRIGIYEVVKDVPIATIEADKLIEIMRVEDDAPKEVKESSNKPAATKKKKTKQNLTKEQAEIIDKIKRHYNLRKIMEHYGVEFKTANGNATCPLHDSENGENLSISKDKNGFWVFHCFHNEGAEDACGWEGDIFTFLMDYKGWKFNDIAKELAKRMGLYYPGTAASLEELALAMNEESAEEDIEKLSKDVLIKLSSNQKKEATEMVADYIERITIIKTLKVDEKKEMWYYNDGIYTPNGAMETKRICRLIFKDAHTLRLVNDVIEKIQGDTQIEQKEFFESQNEHPYVIPVKNGLLNLRTRELSPFNPDIYFFTKLDHPHDPNARCPRIQQFCREIVKTEDDYKVLQELAGYALVKNYKFEKAFMFYGTGRNGKSKYLELLKEFVGMDNFASVKFRDMGTANSFAIANLHAKLVNISTEMSGEALDDTNMFKTLTGNDPVTANRKHKSHLTFRNYAKLIFATNSLPNPKQTDEAFWLRWVVVQFPMKFLTKKDYDALPDEEKQYARIQIPNIVETLINEEEMSGMLNWALDGLARLEANGDFTFTSTAAEIEETWMAMANSAKAFCDRHVEDDRDAFLTIPQLKSAYRQFCRDNKVQPLKIKEFNSYIENNTAASQEMMRIDKDTMTITPNGDRQRVWLGITLKDIA